jgi:hypothetical protein
VKNHYEQSPEKKEAGLKGGWEDVSKISHESL